MWRSVISCLLTAGLTAPAGAEGIPIGVYEVLENHPDCSGPSKIAYRTTFDTILQETDFFRYSENPLGPMNTKECSVSVRRGAERTDYSFPCEGVEEALNLEKASMESFCAATEEMGQSNPRLVALVRVKGNLTGCLSLEGHELIEGTWEALSTELLGSTSIKGEYDDPAMVAVFRPSQKDSRAWSYVRNGVRTESFQGAVHVLGSTTRPPQIFFALTLNNLKLPQFSDQPVGVAGNVVINMVEKSDKGCIESPESCFEKTYDVKTDLRPTEAGTPLACKRSIGEGFAYFVRDDYGPLADYYLLQPDLN